MLRAKLFGKRERLLAYINAGVVLSIYAPVKAKRAVYGVTLAHTHHIRYSYNMKNERILKVGGEVTVQHVFSKGRDVCKEYFGESCTPETI